MKLTSLGLLALAAIGAVATPIDPDSQSLGVRNEDSVLIKYDGVSARGLQE